MKSAVAWFAENHVAANLLMFFILIAGAVTGITMKLETFPETTMDMITVTVPYPGASPAEVEEGIITRIEENVAGLAGIKEISSIAREGVALTRIEVMSDWDAKKLLDEVKSAVDRLTTLPEEAEQPQVAEVTLRNQAIAVAVYGDASEATLKELAEKVRDEVTNLPGITLAETFGVRTGELHIEVSEDTLRRYGVTLAQVAQAVRRASLDLPAGSVKTSAGEVLIRTKGRRYWAREYADVAVVTRSDGSKVTLGQIAKLSDGFEDNDLSARFQGQPGAMVWVYRVADQNALKVAQTIKDYVRDLRPQLPAGVDVEFFSDMSKILKSRISLLTRNMAFGLILVVILLGLFLNLRLAFWVTLGIPISFAAGLMVLPQLDVSINMISLFAFIMVLGIVVDDAIVVGENIYRWQGRGVPRLHGAVEGAIEVGRPVIFSVLTTMVAFYPLLLAGGMMGKFMRNIPIVVIVVLAGSLIESLFILPSHLSGSGRKQKQVDEASAKPKAVARALTWFIQHPYAAFLKFCLQWRYATMAVAIFILLLSVGLFQGGWVKFTFFPKVEGDTLQCMVTMPTGTPPEQTQQLLTELEDKARRAVAEVREESGWQGGDLIEHTFSIVGAQFGDRGMAGESGGHVGQIWVQLMDAEQRPLISSEQINQRWRELAGNVPEAESVTFTAALHSAGNAIEIHFSADDQQTLNAAANALKGELLSTPGVFDIADSDYLGKKEMQLKLKPQARSLGLTLDDLARQVRAAFYGAEALRFQRGGDEVKVLVRYPEDERRSLATAESMRIRLPDGTEVPFSQVAQVEITRGYSSIERNDRRRIIKVTADVDEKVNNAADIRASLEKTFLPKLEADHAGLGWSVEGEGKEQAESMSDVITGFAIALFAIYALLAIPFRSFSQPFIVMTAIPFGFVGALVGHLVMGYNLSILSLFGMVGLAGVVVNDSLVLVHTINRIRGEGNSTGKAVLWASTLRFRAVILTSLTTFAGLFPMLLEKSLQARFLIPMAISLGFGVLFATVITLVLIPSLYMILNDIQRMLGMRKPVEEDTGEEPVKA